MEDGTYKHLSELTREELISTAFDALDPGKIGRLGAEEMYQFACFTDFEGTKENWTHEYQLLCREFGAVPHLGIDLDTFQRLINDETEAGCHCNNEEIRLLLRREKETTPTSRTIFPPGTYIGPVDKVEHTEEYVSIRVRNHWVNIWRSKEQEVFGMEIARLVPRAEVKQWRSRGWKD